MSNRIVWSFDASVGITSFTVEKQTAPGVWSLLTTIPFSTSGGAYDPSLKVFFYDDAPGVPGDVYRIVSIGALGSSEPLIFVASIAPPLMCTIVGYVRNAFGDVDPNIEIKIEAYGTPGERWFRSSSLVSGEPNNVGVVQGSKTVYPNNDGMWQVELIQKAIALITIPDLDFARSIQVPDKAGPINIRDIPELRGPGNRLFDKAQGNRREYPEG